MANSNNLNVFVPNMIAGFILVAFASILLLVLFYKGLRTNSLSQYFTVYAILLNMIVVWTF